MLSMRLSMNKQTQQHTPSLAGGAWRAVYRGVGVCAEVLLPRGRPGAHEHQARGVLRQQVCKVHLHGNRHGLFIFLRTHACMHGIWESLMTNQRLLRGKSHFRTYVRLAGKTSCFSSCRLKMRQEARGRRPWHLPSGQLRPSCAGRLPAGTSRAACPQTRPRSPRPVRMCRRRAAQAQTPASMSWAAAAARGCAGACALTGGGARAPSKAWHRTASSSLLK